MENKHMENKHMDSQQRINGQPNKNIVSKNTVKYWFSFNNNYAKIMPFLVYLRKREFTWLLFV